MKPFPFLVLALSALAGHGAAQSFVNWESPHVHPLELTPDGSYLLAVNTPDNRLEVFDLRGERPRNVLSVPVGLDPVSVRARNNDEVWVVNHVSDSISVIDRRTRSVKATLTTLDEPCDVVFAGAPERAFVSCSQANAILVYDPDDLSAPPTVVEVRGEDPRALAVSPAGDRVYAAIFESGNGTTVLGGGAETNIAFPPNVVSDADGPHGGVNPPPNRGASFEPALTSGLPAPDRMALIVRRNAAGRWMDDNGGDWTTKVSGPQAADSGRPVGWTLLDHDVAVLDASTLALSYADGLMNMNMALAVNPASGLVTVVGTDATNEVRFEPNLTGTFLRVNLGTVVPTDLAATGVVDLNGHLDYAQGTLPVAERERTLSDPRGIVWNALGTRGYVSGMGTNNVVVIDAAGARIGTRPTIEVGEGPTGVVLDEARDRLYVVNKFAASLSVVDTRTEKQIAEVRFFDPSPAAIRRGRRHLYDTHATSGTGLVSCASCHVDARMDRLAWDLGDPSGAMQALEGNLGADLPLLNLGFEDWHPMKGPMLTQTLQDIIGKEPHHWRGDRRGIEAFNPAFVGLLGDDRMLTTKQMQEFEDFLATIFFPPNPYRTPENALPEDLPLPVHFTTGRFGQAGLPLPNGNARRGRDLFRPFNFLDDGVLACSTCHTEPTGAGTDHRFNNFQFQPIPPGPKGERHLALVSVDGSTNVTMKVAQLRNLYERTGFNATQLESTAGFGYLHDGSIDSIERFVTEPVFEPGSVQEVADLVAFLLAFGGETESPGNLTPLLEPPGPPSQVSHALVGRQLTVTDGQAMSLDDAATLALLLQEAGQGDVGLVVKGRVGGEHRGWMFVAGGRFQSDRRDEELALDTLLALAAPQAELTFTAVPRGSERRIGIDRDADGSYDRDELDRHSDPANPRVRPKVHATEERLR